MWIGFKNASNFQALHWHFLRSDAAGKSEAMLPTMKRILALCDSFVASKIYHSAAPEKSPLREDVARLLTLLRVVCSETDVVGTELEAAEAARLQLVKGKTAFQSALTIYPAGVFLVETISGLINQSRKDQALQAEIQGVFEFTQGMKPFCRDTIVRERDGEYEISVPLQAKVADMTAKFFSFKDNASDRAKDASSTHLAAIDQHISQLHGALLEAATLRFEKKFPKFDDFMEDLATGKLSDSKTTECLQMLAELSSYHGLPKVHLGKMLGKELASDIAGKLGAVSSISRLLQGALAKLCSLSAGSATEELLFEDRVTALFKGSSCAIMGCEPLQGDCID